MRALGFNTNRYKLAAFIIAGMLAGVAGHMWACTRGFVNPELVGWHRVGRGAAHHPARRHRLAAGAVVGAFAFYGLGEAAQLITERKLLVEGIVILVVVVLLRDGLVGIRLPRLRRKRRRTPTRRDPRRASMADASAASWRRRACRVASAACPPCATSRSA